MWRTHIVTMCTGWGGRLRDACRLLAIPVDNICDDGFHTAAVITTQRTQDELEDALRGQLQFGGWMSVEEENAA